MALHLHRGARTATLADGLADLLATPPADPFAVEVVAVPAAGVERWLSQRLSHRLGVGGDGPAERSDGVCAAVDFRTPWSLVAEVLGTGDEDPWAPGRLCWPVLAALDAHLDEPWAQVLARHLGAVGSPTAGGGAEPAPHEDPRRGRRLAVARRLTGLFTGYAAQRPALLAAWESGRDDDGLGRPLEPDLSWQAPLWRAVVARVDAPTPGTRHTDVLERVRRDPATSPLPARLSLFGHTRLTATDLDVLGALAVHREVHLWLPHPAPRLWARLGAALEQAQRPGPVPRRLDESHRLVEHPLLASMGRDLRELQRSLAGLAAATDVALDPPATPRPATLLGWLQADLRADRPPTSAERASRVLRPDDRSIQVHACHGPARQVEVLREVLLGLLADDASLEPTDILVMCPDIETFAPLVQAAFGLGAVVGPGGHPAHRLRVRLADRALHQTNPLLGVLARLLELAGGRATAAEVLDLADAEPVRRRFRFTDADLEQVTTWVREAGVRWGFDAGHRRDVGLEDVVQNTWRFGIDRILAGVALSEQEGRWVDTAYPLDDVDSSSIELVGRLAEFVDRLAQATDRLTGVQPLAAWVEAMGQALGALTEVAAADAWQAGQAQRELALIHDTAAAGGLDATTLRLGDIRALMTERLAGRPTRASFRTGTLTVCTMVPMRSVPHRVIALLGLDDGTFPRSAIPDGDDVLARDPVTGERDPRSEDRQLLLDAVLAAEQTLVLLHTGADPHSGAPRPPAVPLGELLDALDRTATAAHPPDAQPDRPGPAHGGQLRIGELVTVRHPLQPFDPRNHIPGALVPGQAFSFDRDALAAASAGSATRTPAPAFLDQPLDAPVDTDVALDDLVAFVRHPVRHFLTRGRLELALPVEPELLRAGIPVEVTRLDQWPVAERLLADLLTHDDPRAARDREWRRGALPPGHLGWGRLGELLEDLAPLVERARSLRGGPPRALDVDVDLGGGRRLRGTVTGLVDDRLVTVSASRLAAPARLGTWVRLLALTAHDPGTPWTGHTIGRPPRRARAAVGHARLGPLDAGSARAQLLALVALLDAGRRHPLPLPVKTAEAYAVRRRERVDAGPAVDQALAAWRDADLPGGRSIPGERSDAAHLRVWPDGRLPGTTTPPPAGLDFPGETHAFGALARRLIDPLLDAEASADKVAR